MLEQSDITKILARLEFDIFWRLGFKELEPGRLLHDNWHLRFLARLLMQVERGEIRRLIINVPPRSMKSLLTSVTFPAFLMGRDPTRRIICVSYAEGLARKFSVHTRTIMQSAWYRALFPQTVLASRKPPQLELVTTSHGHRYAAGFGGSITGQGADFIICDDPIKPLDALSEKSRLRSNEFFDSTLVTRLNDKKTGAIILVMQRLHEDDLVGHLIEQGGWTVVALPAIAEDEETYRLSNLPGDIHVRKVDDILHPAREGEAELAEMRQRLGSYHYAAQYQQTPVPRSGNVIKREWLKFWVTTEANESADDDNTVEGSDEQPDELLIASWDTASTIKETSDYSVGQVWAKIGDEYHLIHQVRGKFEAPELKRRIVELHKDFELAVTVLEDTELGRAMEQSIRQDRSIRVKLSKPKFDKVSRLSIQSVKFENGQVLLPKDAPWLDAYINELIAFPNGKHDDQVDATSQALHYLSERGSRTPQMLNVKVTKVPTHSNQKLDPYDTLRSR